MPTKVHSELLRQLAQSDDRPVQAVVHLCLPDKPQQIPSPDDTARLADTVLQRVQQRIGHPAIRSNVLRNLATLVVEADPAFLRSLVEQPEVFSALPNEMAESPFIPPARP